jgi:hypothetical protein
MLLPMCACVCAYVCAHARVCACVCAHMCVCARACEHMCGGNMIQQQYYTLLLSLKHSVVAASDAITHLASTHTRCGESGSGTQPH